MDKIKTKQDLLNYIKSVLRKRSYDRNFIIKLTKKLEERISSSKISDLISGNEVSVNDSELYWLGVTLSELKNKYDIPYSENTLSLFTEQEVNEAENYIIQQGYDNEELRTIYIDRAIRLKRWEYIVVDMTYEKIAEAWKKGVTTYNYDTQREAKIINTGIGLVYEPTIYKENIDKMVDKMVKRKFYDNVITWNVLHTKHEDFTYFEDTQKLKFVKGKGSQINIVDGFHRTLAIIEALELNPELKDEIMQVKILNLDVNQALEYINQEQQGSAIGEDRKKSSIKDNVTTIIDDLNKNGDSKLNGKISTIEDEVYKYHAKTVLFGTLSDSVQDWYNELKDAKTSQLNNTYRHIEEVLNYIITYYEDDFMNIKTSQEKGRIFTQNNMFLGYIWLSHKLYDIDNWDEVLNNFLNKLDQQTLNINIETKNRNKAYRNKVYEVFRNIWESLQ